MIGIYKVNYNFNEKINILKSLIKILLSFFITSILLMGLIVWTLQAVNYFDIVSEDGHGLNIYFLYYLKFSKNYL